MEGANMADTPFLRELRGHRETAIVTTLRRGRCDAWVKRGSVETEKCEHEFLVTINQDGKPETVCSGCAELEWI